jgi:hypothetical protein
MRLFPLAPFGSVTATPTTSKKETAEREVAPSRNQTDSTNRSEQSTDNVESQRSGSLHSHHVGEMSSTVFCAYDGELDSTLRTLHKKMMQGDMHAQVHIDGHLLAASCPDAAVRNLLVTGEAHTLTYRALPDLTQFLSALLDPQPQSIFLCHLLQQLSPLRRRVRVRRTRALQPACGVEAVTCISLLFATIVGLYPRACKFPLYQTRREVAVAMYRLKTARLTTQIAFISALPALQRLALLEYTLNIRHDFAPVEQAYLSRLAPHVPQYDNAILAACDSLRHTCLQDVGGWSWNALEACAVQMVDRVGRICRATIVNRAPPPNVAPSKDDLAAALHAHVVFGCGTSSVTEIARARVHNALQTFTLPRNMVHTQATQLLAAHVDNLLLLHNACTKHMCIACLLHGGNKSFQKKLKLRLDTRSDTLICANCGKSAFVVRVNVFGKLIRVGAGAFFCCALCATLQPYNPANPLHCSRCKQGAQLKKNQQKKRECFFCQRVCMSRPITLLYAPAACMVQVALCFKHTPPAHAWQFIEDLAALRNFMSTAVIRRKRRNFT